MKILVHHHKYGDAYYDATDELWAFGELFKSLDEFQCYDADIIESKKELEVIAKARAGDLEAARLICRKHKDYEYEGYSLEEVKQNHV